ncbi:MAG: PadR family transcriptional regulator [Chloroflexota bacterium]|nr:PadR family transcriptional regulator [Chloroflexota bacterium]
MRDIVPDETILGLLAHRARHGYELVDVFQAQSQLGRVWSMSTSQIYAVLKRLEQQHLIMGEQAQSETAPTRTVYRLTSEGERRLQAWLLAEQVSPSVRRIRVEFLSRLYIARLLSVDTVPIVAAQRRICELEMERLREKRRYAHGAVEQLALDFMIAQVEAILVWIARCE